MLFTQSDFINIIRSLLSRCSSGQPGIITRDAKTANIHVNDDKHRMKRSKQMAEEKITSTLRLRMSAKDAHYGGELVDGAHMVHLFGDVATGSLTILHQKSVPSGFGN